MVVSLQRKSKKCRMADRLFSVFRKVLKERLKDAKILTDVMGSDHCPIELDMD